MQKHAGTWTHGWRRAVAVGLCLSGLVRRDPRAGRSHPCPSSFHAGPVAAFRLLMGSQGCFHPHRSSEVTLRLLQISVGQIEQIPSLSLGFPTWKVVRISESSFTGLPRDQARYMQKCWTCVHSRPLGIAGGLTWISMLSRLRVSNPKSCPGEVLLD